MLLTRRARRPRRGPEAQDVLLAALVKFRDYTGENPSLAQFYIVLKELSAALHLGYQFLQTISYSYELTRHIDDLAYRNLVFEYRYMHNGLLPKTFLAPTPLGMRRAADAIASMDATEGARFRRYVRDSVERLPRAWQFYGRPSLAEREESLDESRNFQEKLRIVGEVAGLLSDASDEQWAAYVDGTQRRPLFSRRIGE